MPYREAIVGELQLAGAVTNGAVPSFIGSVDERALTICFDNAALLAIRGSRTNTATTEQALVEQQDRVRAAAQMLLRSGFWRETEDGRLEVLVTAIDL